MKVSVYFKVLTIIICLAAGECFAAQGKLISGRAELLLGNEANGVGGTIEGGLFYRNGLFLSLQAGGGWVNLGITSTTPRLRNLRGITQNIRK